MYQVTVTDAQIQFIFMIQKILKDVLDVKNVKIVKIVYYVIIVLTVMISLVVNTWLITNKKVKNTSMQFNVKRI